MQSVDFKRRKRFVGYLTAGDGGNQYSVEAALALIAGGVDVLELGVPFSDPVADGPVIQSAMERALRNKTTPWDVLDIAAEIRKHSAVPIVLMSYLNPILSMPQDFLTQAKTVGVQAVLLVDAPMEVVSETAKGVQHVSLITPASSEERLKKAIEHDPFFLYYVIHKGTTGMRKELPEKAKDQLLQIKRKTNIPVVAGFGIADRGQAEKILEIADGFVVGSLFVQAIGRKENPTALCNLAQSIDPRGA
jgi:tryptophan synthase alpha chain